MFRDGLPSAGARRDQHVLAKAPLATLVPYGLLVAAALATGVHLILTALHAPLRLLPLPVPGPISLGMAPSVLMAASVAALLTALAGLGLRALVQRRATPERSELADLLPGASQPSASTGIPTSPAASGFMVLFDVAHFAFLSQRHGAKLADGAVRLVADELSRAFRAPHQVRHSDAGEFLVMVATQELDHCILLVEQVRRSVASQTIAAGGAGVVIALSAGLARIGPGESPSAARQAAQRALDHARNAASERPVYAFERHAKPVC